MGQTSGSNKPQTPPTMTGGSMGTAPVPNWWQKNAGVGAGAEQPATGTTDYMTPATPAQPMAGQAGQTGNATYYGQTGAQPSQGPMGSTWNWGGRSTAPSTLPPSTNVPMPGGKSSKGNLPPTPAGTVGSIGKGQQPAAPAGSTMEGGQTWNPVTQTWSAAPPAGTLGPATLTTGMGVGETTPNVIGGIPTPPPPPPPGSTAPAASQAPSPTIPEGSPLAKLLAGKQHTPEQAALDNANLAKGIYSYNGTVYPDAAAMNAAINQAQNASTGSNPLWKQQGMTSTAAPTSFTSSILTPVGGAPQAAVAGGKKTTQPVKTQAATTPPVTDTRTGGNRNWDGKYVFSKYGTVRSDDPRLTQP